MTQSLQDGVVEQIENGYQLRYERYLRHPVEKVWEALTDPARLEDWLGAVEGDLVEGGSYTIRWLNTDLDGNNAVAVGTITRLEPPHVLEVDTDIHGLLRWELRPDGSGSHLTLTARSPITAEWLAIVLAGWHIHLDFLEESLDGKAVDWPNWPFDRWEAHHRRYEARLG
jgi:uncharacterized protein YndB with AHSA1/START domain